MDAGKAAEYGINFDSGLRSCMGDKDFYLKILNMFLSDTCFERAKEAYEQGDFKTLFCCIHELKGISGNAGLMSLYDAATVFTELLRHDDAEKIAVDREFKKVEEIFTLTIEGVTEINRSGIELPAG